MSCHPVHQETNIRQIPCHPWHQAADAVPLLRRRRWRLFSAFHPCQLLIYVVLACSSCIKYIFTWSPKSMNNSFFIWLHGTSSTGSRIKILQKTILYAPVTCHVSSQFTESNCNKLFWSSLAVQLVSSVVQIVVNPSQPPSNLGSQWYCWTTSQPIWF